MFYDLKTIAKQFALVARLNFANAKFSRAK
jgi:hypothetical protein